VYQDINELLHDEGPKILLIHHILKLLP
jgi:hypothetical protein